jgi:hypothetical protein
MAYVVKYHQQNRVKDLPSVFNDESTGMEIFVRTIIKEKLEKGISKEDILKDLKLLEVSEENRNKCIEVIKEELGEEGTVLVHNYFDFNTSTWKSNQDDVGAFEDFFV